jgi:hypothetical protein
MMIIDNDYVLFCFILFKAIKNIDGVNQWNAIIKNKKSNRNEFVYNVDPLGNGLPGDCLTPSEAVR